MKYLEHFKTTKKINSSKVAGAMLLSLGMILLLAPTIRAQTIDTIPLSRASFGIGLSGHSAISDDLKLESDAFFGLSVLNSIYLNDHVNLSLEAEWLMPGSNFGAAMGSDVFFNSSGFRPFLGASVGFFHFDKTNDFGENFGPMLKGRIGFVLDALDEMQIRLSLPYRIVFNQGQDQSAGVEIGLLFSGPHRNTKIKRINL